MTTYAATSKIRRATNKQYRDWLADQRMKTVQLCCEYCGVTCSLRVLGQKFSASVDHKIPLARGGEDKPSNWAVCCRWCNDKKGCMTADEYTAHRKAQRAQQQQRKAAKQEQVMKTTASESSPASSPFPVPASHIQTFTGKHINPFDPDPAAIDIEDIAHALSNICRFTGHVRTFYSVAQHCVHVADHVLSNLPKSLPPQDKSRYGLMALLHDAGEAYLCDIPRPIKPHVHVQPNLEMAAGTRGNLCRYRDAEAQVQLAVFDKYCFRVGGPQSVVGCMAMIHVADLVLLATERRDLLTPTAATWPDLEGVTPLPQPIVPLAPAAAKTEFLRLFHELTREACP